MADFKKEFHEAVTWVESRLGRGPELSRDIEAAARRQYKFSFGTLVRVKAKLGIRSVKIRGEWFWCLPGTPPVTPQAAPSASVTPGLADPAPEPDIPAFLNDPSEEPNDWFKITPTPSEIAEAKREAGIMAASKVELWLEPNPDRVLEQHTSREIDAMMTTMREKHFEGKLPELSNERLQSLLVHCRSAKKRKFEQEKNPKPPIQDEIEEPF